MELNNTEIKKEKNISMEILRSVAMLMIVTLHYLQKGGLLSESLVGATGSQGLFWLLEMLCIGSTNVFVLISGYFMADSKFNIWKVVRLWGQVFFYSIIVLIAMILCGAVDYKDFLNLHELMFYFCPLSMGHYWFATTYMILYIVSPVLIGAAKKADKKSLGITVLLLLTVSSLLKSVIPFELTFDDRGLGILSFISLFMTGVYIRMYGCPIFKTKLTAFFGFVSFALLAWVFRYGASIFVGNTGKYEQLISISTDFNFIFIVGIALGLFMFFLNADIKKNGFTGFLVRIAPYTFGVYLLHEHNLLRYRWLEFLKVGETYEAFRPAHLMLSVLFVFGAGIIIDLIRSLIFKLIERLWAFAMKIYNAKREVFDYLIFGVLATVVNWAAYIITSRVYIVHLIPDDETLMKMVSNVIAWIAAVLFAYWTNRTFVFKSEVTGKGAVFKEFVAFIGARITTFLVEMFLFWIMIDKMHINDIVSKVVISVVVIILNYVFSKLFIFKKSDNKEKIKEEEK